MTILKNKENNMTHATRVINAAAAGIRSRSFHEYWQDCNPSFLISETPQERKEKTFLFLRSNEKFKLRLKGARILRDTR